MLAVEQVARRGAFTLGDEVAAFEREFADYCEVDHAVGVASGTDALLLCLRAMGIGRGDEVLVPTNSFVATAEAVALAGATPRLLDVDPASHTITAKIVEPALSTRTRCIIPVHLYGRTANMRAIIELARSRGILVIEDACQAHGAIYDGRRAGTIGDAGCFSFYPAKNLGGWGDGGAVVTSTAKLAETLRLLRSHGESPKHHHRVCGTSARLDGVQAAVLRAKLRRLDAWNAARRRIAGALTAALAAAPVTAPSPPPEGHDHVFHLYVAESDERDLLRCHLHALGIATGVHYPRPIHLQEAFAYLGAAEGSLPVAERLASRILSLPIHPSMTIDMVGRIAHAVSTCGDESDPSMRLLDPA